MKRLGLLFDSTMCIGCGACVAACKETNNLPGDPDPRLTAYTWTVLENRGDTFMRRLCMHCESPTCVSVCPVGAFTKTPAGPVTYDGSKCIGCRYCIMACPFDVPKYQWDRTAPLVQKCTMCAARVAAGKPTACAEACPTGATAFGAREDFLKEARGRLAAEPAKYVPRIFGESEVGGTDVLMLSGKPFEQFGIKAVDRREALPLLTWRVLSRIPDFTVVWGTLLFGIFWITNRRAYVQEQIAREAEAAKQPEE
ncbi:MAG: 4Fe-4S dicluster domain-containing protein [Candidatus Methylomirabilales bacterium]